MERCGGSGPVERASHRYIERARSIRIRRDDLDLVAALRHLGGELGNPAGRATVPRREPADHVEDSQGAAQASRPSGSSSSPSAFVRPTNPRVRRIGAMAMVISRRALECLRVLSSQRLSATITGPTGRVSQWCRRLHEPGPGGRPERDEPPPRRAARIPAAYSERFPEEDQSNRG